MRKLLLFFIPVFLLTASMRGDSQNYKEGEFLKYRVHYGLLNAGFASLTINSSNYDGRPHYHMVGEGSSSGAVRVFFPVDDRYETFIDAATNKPTKFIRNIREGGYKRYQIFSFNHKGKNAKIEDRLEDEVYYRNFSNDVQDLLSAFYYFRNHDFSNLKTGDFVSVDILMHDETYKFKLKILGRENFKTKFGTVKTLKVRPYVQSGRIFKASESVTMWVTDDQNHIPVQIRAELAVGSLKADLFEYKNTKYPIPFK